MKKLLYKLFGCTDKHDSTKPINYKNINDKPPQNKYDELFELYQTQNINVKDLENKYNKLLELQYAQNEEIAKLRHMIHYMDKSLPRFAKSIQNLEVLFNPSDITNMYFDKSSTLNYLMEYLNNKTKK